MKFKSSHLAFLAAIQLTGCSSLFISDENICFNDNGKAINCADLSNNTTVQPADMNPANVTNLPEVKSMQDPSLFQSTINFQLVNEYIEQMTTSMKRSIADIDLGSGIAVTPFINLSSGMKDTSLLGNHISEYFINELRNSGLPVSDYKVKGIIQGTTHGTLMMTDELAMLKKNKHVGYVLTGTLIKHARGTMVNARIVSVDSNVVIASSSRLIPKIVTARFN